MNKSGKKKLAWFAEHSFNDRIRLLAQIVKEQAEALEKAKEDILYTHEKGAEELAIAAGLGVSEWQSFMPSQYHTIVKQIQSTNTSIEML